MTFLSVVAVAAILGLLLLMLRSGPRGWLSFTFLGLLGVVGLYVFDMLRLPEDVLWRFISPRDYQALILLALLFLAVFGLGEAIGFRFGYRNPRAATGALPRRYWIGVAIVLFLLGFLGQVAWIQQSGGFSTFYGAAHGSAGDFSSSAYLYRLPHSMFTAAVILLVFAIQKIKLSPVAKAVLALAFLFLLFDVVTQGKRGGVIRYVLMIVIPYVALDAMTRKRAVLLMVGAGCAMIFLLVLPYIRWALTISSLSELTDALSALPDLMDAASQADYVTMEGKHAVFGALVVGGALQHSEANFGFRWLFPFISLIPRAIWPDKPLRYEFSDNDFYDVSRSYSNVYIPDGSYPGGIAESFTEWSYLVVFVWLLMGLILGYVRGRTYARKTMNWIILLFCLSVFFAHFVLQDTIQGTLSLIFLAGPFFVVSVIFRLLLPPRRPPLTSSRSNRQHELARLYKS